MNPLDGLPSVNYVSVISDKVRRSSINEQLDKYRIISRYVNVVDRYNDIKQDLKVSGPFVDSMPELGIGAVTTHLLAIKHWYLNSSESFSLFCEDDISFQLCDYWGFSIRELVSKIPRDWDALQLVRIRNGSESDGISLRLRYFNDWGANSYLLNRAYAGRLVAKYFKDDEIVLDCDICQPIIENVLYRYGVVYNLPLFVERLFEGDKIDVRDREKGINPNHRLCVEYYTDLWKNNTKSLDEIVSSLSSAAPPYFTAPPSDDPHWLSVNDSSKDKVLDYVYNGKRIILGDE